MKNREYVFVKTCNTKASVSETVDNPFYSEHIEMKKIFVKLGCETCSKVIDFASPCNTNSFDGIEKMAEAD